MNPQITKLKKVIRVIEEFRKLDGGIQAQAQHVFLFIAANPGCTVNEAAKATEISSASATRNIQLLGKQHRKGKPGLQLVELVDDPNDMRIKHAHLSTKGKLVAKSLAEIIDG